MLLARGLIHLKLVPFEAAPAHRRAPAACKLSVPLLHRPPRCPLPHPLPRPTSGTCSPMLFIVFGTAFPNSGWVTASGGTLLGISMALLWVPAVATQVSPRRCHPLSLHFVAVGLWQGAVLGGFAPALLGKPPFPAREAPPPHGLGKKSLECLTIVSFWHVRPQTKHVAGSQQSFP